jgi:hypothetical protein
MKARTVLVTVDNQTGKDLSLESKFLQHGIWTEDEKPPDIIPVNSTKQYQAESHGFMTGTEGYVVYKIGDGPTVILNFDNPLLVRATVDGQDSGHYDAAHSGGRGLNPKITYTVKRKG